MLTYCSREFTVFSNHKLVIKLVLKNGIYYITTTAGKRADVIVEFKPSAHTQVRQNRIDITVLFAFVDLMWSPGFNSSLSTCVQGKEDTKQPNCNLCEQSSLIIYVFKYVNVKKKIVDEELILLRLLGVSINFEGILCIANLNIHTREQVLLHLFRLRKYQRAI